MKIGAAIRKIRLEKGLTLEQVALDADTYAGNLSKIERGRHQPSLELLHKIAAALDTRMSELYAIVENLSDSESRIAKNPDANNEVILIRRNFHALTPANRRIAIELLKALARTQGAEQL